MTEAREVLSALIDGEAVDAGAVADALEVPANRALLVDFIRLRESVQREDGAAPRWRPDSVAALATPAATGRRVWLRAAAVVALLSAGALGGTWVQGVLTQERPPEPTRVVQLEPITVIGR